MKAPRLPPLAALRAFEAAARRRSFKAAAEELFVTPSAVSHQVRQLEDHLGVRLLDRDPRSVALTAEGRLLYDGAASGFEAIARATASLRAVSARRPLVLTSTPAFLSHWLMPRLSDLHARTQIADLRLHASHRVEAFEPGAIDVAIRYAPAVSPELFSLALSHDALSPACSPSLKIRRPEGLGRATLIHVDGVTHPTPAPTWARWRDAAGIDDLDVDAGLHFPDSMLAVQAAIAGHGVVLASRILVSGAIEAGLLEQPFETGLTGDAFHFVCAADRQEEPAIVALRRWFEGAMRL